MLISEGLQKAIRLLLDLHILQSNQPECDIQDDMTQDNVNEDLSIALSSLTNRETLAIQILSGDLEDFNGVLDGWRPYRECRLSRLPGK